MRPYHRAGRALARSLALCLSLCLSTPALADLLAWRAAPNLPALAGHLDLWLDRHTDLPRRHAPPAIRLVTPAAAAARFGDHRAAGQARLRGFYDAETATIWLVRPFDPRDPRDASVLLHELVHHRQVEAGHWYCPGAQELPAYRLQEAWLAQLGLEAEVNWIAVVLEAGCSPRDIHP